MYQGSELELPCHFNSQMEIMLILGQELLPHYTAHVQNRNRRTAVGSKDVTESLKAPL